MSGLFLAAASLGILGCASTPAGQRPRIVELPLASVQSDLAFTISTDTRRQLACALDLECSEHLDTAAAQRFAAQVRRVGDTLQTGAQKLHPDLASRLPQQADGHFAILVVEGDEPGSASSANGRIAINAGFAGQDPSDGFLAFVIAREMGHVLARHHEENSSAGIMASALLNALLPGSGLLKTLIAVGGSRVAAISNRPVQAREADAIARELLAASGYRLQDVSRDLLVALAPLDDGPWAKQFRASSSDLIADLRKTEATLGAATALEFRPAAFRAVSVAAAE